MKIVLGLMIAASLVGCADDQNYIVTDKMMALAEHNCSGHQGVDFVNGAYLLQQEDRDRAKRQVFITCNDGSKITSPYMEIK